MNTYTNIDFSGHYPVGSAAVVLAETPAEAARRLNAVLRDAGLPGDALAKDMKPFPAEGESVRILVDGNY